MHVADHFHFRHRNQSFIYHFVEGRNKCPDFVLRIYHRDHDWAIGRAQQMLLMRCS